MRILGNGGSKWFFRARNLFTQTLLGHQQPSFPSERVSSFSDAPSTCYPLWTHLKAQTRALGLHPRTCQFQGPRSKTTQYAKSNIFLSIPRNQYCLGRCKILSGVHKGPALCMSSSELGWKCKFRTSLWTLCNYDFPLKCVFSIQITNVPDGNRK